MKRILITGKNSYVGNSLEKWLSQYPDKYHVDKISLRDGTWKEEDFSLYDSIVHVAGIAHISNDPKMEETYYKVNRDLTIKLAKKAKNEQVKQFIFMSSIIVYGNSDLKDGVIDEDTVPVPANFYGESKLQAENGIKTLEDEHFKVAIIRPPMIYGKGSKGNYPKLSKAAQKLPIFPDFENKRSMLHIDNLSEFLMLVIDNEDKGTFFPQNKEYVNTSELVKMISEAHGKKIRLVKLFNPVLSIILHKIDFVSKVFGNLVYDKSLSKYKERYHIKDLRQSIKTTELENELP